MSKTQHRVSPEAAFAPLVEQMEMLARELFVIRERAHSGDCDSVGDRINALPGTLSDFKRRLKARMESFERRLSKPPDQDWIEEGLGRFESYATGLSGELSALKEELDAKYNGMSRVLDDFQEELDARVRAFAAAVVGKAQ